MSDCNIVTSGQHWYQAIVQFDKTIVLPRKRATGNIHDYLFGYCPLVGILFEVLRIVCHLPLSAIHSLSFPIFIHSPLHVIPHCLSFPIVCHHRLSGIPHCLSSLLSVIYHCLSVSIVCHSSLSIIHHCLSFPIVHHLLWSDIQYCLSFHIVCHPPLFAITHCPSFPIFWHS